MSARGYDGEVRGFALPPVPADSVGGARFRSAGPDSDSCCIAILLTALRHSIAPHNKSRELDF